MTRRSRGARLLVDPLGSTSEALAHGCTRPLVVVPRTMRPAATRGDSEPLEQTGAT